MSLRFDGPDFLHNVADAERANGNEINAATYDQRAREWRDDLRELEQLRERAESAEYRLAQIQAQAMAA